MQLVHHTKKLLDRSQNKTKHLTAHVTLSSVAWLLLFYIYLYFCFINKFLVTKKIKYLCFYVFQVRDTVLPSRSSTLLNPPFPTYFTEEDGDLDEDLYDEDLFVHTEPSLTLTWPLSHTQLFHTNLLTVPWSCNKRVFPCILSSLVFVCVCERERCAGTKNVCLIQTVITSLLVFFFLSETMVTVGVMMSLEDPQVERERNGEEKKTMKQKQGRSEAGMLENCAISMQKRRREGGMEMSVWNGNTDGREGIGWYGRSNELGIKQGSKYKAVLFLFCFFFRWGWASEGVEGS